MPRRFSPQVPSYGVPPVRHNLAPRGRVFWIETAKDLEDAKSKVKTFYAQHPAEYFAFDATKQTTVLFTLEELRYQNGQELRLSGSDWVAGVRP